MTDLPADPHTPAAVPLAPRSVQLRVLWWLACDLASVPLHLAVFLFTANLHRRRLRDALLAGGR